MSSDYWVFKLKVVLRSEPDGWAYLRALRSGELDKQIYDQELSLSEMKARFGSDWARAMILGVLDREIPPSGGSRE
jgi:hypothetical protein